MCLWLPGIVKTPGMLIYVTLPQDIFAADITEVPSVKQILRTEDAFYNYGKRTLVNYLRRKTTLLSLHEHGL